MKFSELLTRYKKESGLTQQNIADKLGVTKVTISHWCSGKCTPATSDAEIINRISELINLPVKEITMAILEQNGVQMEQSSINEYWCWFQDDALYSDFVLSKDEVKVFKILHSSFQDKEALIRHCFSDVIQIFPTVSAVKKKMQRMQDNCLEDLSDWIEQYLLKYDTSEFDPKTLSNKNLVDYINTCGVVHGYSWMNFSQNICALLKQEKFQFHIRSFKGEYYATQENTINIPLDELLKFHCICSNRTAIDAYFEEEISKFINAKKQYNDYDYSYREIPKTLQQKLKDDFFQFVDSLNQYFVKYEKFDDEDVAKYKEQCTQYQKALDEYNDKMEEIRKLQYLYDKERYPDLPEPVAPVMPEPKVFITFNKRALKLIELYQKVYLSQDTPSTECETPQDNKAENYRRKLIPYIHKSVTLDVLCASIRDDHVILRNVYIDNDFVCDHMNIYKGNQKFSESMLGQRVLATGTVYSYEGKNGENLAIQVNDLQTVE